LANCFYWGSAPPIARLARQSTKRKGPADRIDLDRQPAGTFAFLVPFLLPSKAAGQDFELQRRRRGSVSKLEREDRPKLGATRQTIFVAQMLVNPGVWHFGLCGFGHGFAGCTFKLAAAASHDVSLYFHSRFALGELQHHPAQTRGVTTIYVAGKLSEG